MSRRLTAAALFALVPAFVPAAQAGEGVLEINRTCAVETGCFPGDAAGYPVTITSAGSYRLTGNLSFQSGSGSQSEDMISITAPDVQLDLAGFRISCRALQVGAVCTGSADGIVSTARGTTVVGGSVVGMSGDGVDLDEDGRIVDVTVLDNGQLGVFSGPGTVVERVIARGNGFAGILVGSSSTVQNSVANENRDGIGIGARSVARGNTASENEGVGFSALSGSSLIGNSASGNGDDGFSLPESQLGTTTPGGLVKGNTANDNGGFGFDDSLGQSGVPQQNWGLIDNVAKGNNRGGDQIRGGIEMGQNVCGTDLSCP